MAMYEQTTDSVLTNFQASGSVALTTDVLNTILSLVGGDGTISLNSGNFAVGVSTISSGTSEVFFLDNTGSGQVSGTIDTSQTPVLILQGAGGFDITITSSNGTTTTEHVVIGSSGTDKIVIVDGNPWKVVVTGPNSTVVGGTGNDTIEAGHSNSTITGGGGHDQVQINGEGDSSHFSVGGTTGTSGANGSPQAGATGSVVITDNVTGVKTTVSGIQYVALDNNDALIFAASTVEAGVADLYHAAFGRTADAEGLAYWYDLVKGGESLHDVAFGFMNSVEYKAGTGTLSDTAFITALYHNTFNRAPDDGGLAYWQQQLAHGATRGDLLTQFATVAALNDAGTLHTEAVVVGSVTIVPNIV
jgi:hypothetical protein